MEKIFDAPEVMQIFPTFVWKGDVPAGAREPLNAELLAALAGMGAPLSGLRPGENWQSGHDLHVLPPFRQLTDWLLAASNAALAYLRLREPLVITGLWANLNPPGTGHRLHSHRNNYLSGAYYLQVQEGADTINFFDPKPQAGVIRPHPSEPTAENTEVASVRVTTGSLLLFPAWLQHAVDPNRSGKLRISLSFNLMFAGFAERMAQPAWQPGKGGPQ
jgi:uncharacterized protein (TIGR02466 family)